LAFKSKFLHLVLNRDNIGAKYKFNLSLNNPREHRASLL